MKPIGRKNYGSIPHLSNSKLGSGDYFITIGQEKILTVKTRDKHDRVLVFEKYDGSNVGVAKVNGKIIPLTRSGYEAITSKYTQHHKFAEYVERESGLFDQLLQEGERIVGEWLYQAHGIIYDIKGPPIVFFDWFDSKNNRLPFEYLKSSPLSLPRLIHSGQAEPVEWLIPELNIKTDSICAQEDPEGMVYRVERKGKVDFLAKWVRPDFEPGKYIIGVDEKDLICNVSPQNCG